MLEYLSEDFAPPFCFFSRRSPRTPVLAQCTPSSYSANLFGDCYFIPSRPPTVPTPAFLLCPLLFFLFLAVCRGNFILPCLPGFAPGVSIDGKGCIPPLRTCACAIAMLFFAGVLVRCFFFSESQLLDLECRGVVRYIDRRRLALAGFSSSILQELILVGSRPVYILWLAFPSRDQRSSPACV